MSQTIVVICDDPSTALQLQMALTGAARDCRIKVIAGKEELRDCAPTLIILDLLLAHEPACELLSWLRRHPPYDTIPIFVLGSESVERDVSEAYRVGANGCLRRGASGEELGPLAQSLAVYANIRSATGCN